MKIYAHLAFRVVFAFAVLCGGSMVKAQGLYFDPGTLSFSNTEAGSTSATQQITVTNFDPVALTVTAVTPPANPAFEVTHDCPVGIYQPFASCTIEVIFTVPNAAGSVQDVFQFESITYGTQDIRLSGNSDGAPVSTVTSVPTIGQYGIGLLSLLIGATLVWSRYGKRFC
ncbi:MAG: hypothetical protein WBC18_17580 [Ottowia sp.]|uniref:Ig-like domain-containing protein n=1 Tax=unclassified Ottowia TaxID=2645081 RepID=UPI003C2C6ABF